MPEGKSVSAYSAKNLSELAAVPLVSYVDVDEKEARLRGIQVTFAITGVFQIIAFQFAGVVAGGRQLAQCTNCGLSFPLTGIARETGASAPHASREKSRPGMQHVTIAPDSATKVTNQAIRALRLVGPRLAECATEPSVISEGGCTGRCPVRGPAHCKRQSEQSQFFWYRNP